MKKATPKEAVFVVQTQLVEILDKPNVGKAMRDKRGRLIYMVSNSGHQNTYWTWKRIRADGTLSTKTYSGYNNGRDM